RSLVQIQSSRPFLTQTMTRSTKFLSLGILGVLVLIAGWLVVQYRRILHHSEGSPQISLSDIKDPFGDFPGERVRVLFAEPRMSSVKRKEFLAGEFKVVQRMNALPNSVVRQFKVKGASNLEIADTGQKFLSTDVITASGLPRGRLIFAGIDKENVF